MINVSGHLRNERRATGFADDSSPLSVNCCGLMLGFQNKGNYFSRTVQREDRLSAYIYLQRCRTLLYE